MVFNSVSLVSLNLSLWVLHSCPYCILCFYPPMESSLDSPRGPIGLSGSLCLDLSPKSLGGSWVPLVNVVFLSLKKCAVSKLSPASGLKRSPAKTMKIFFSM